LKFNLKRKKFANKHFLSKEFLFLFRSFFFKYTGKESLKEHQQQIKVEITRARVALSGPLRRKLTKYQFLFLSINFLLKFFFI
jgi:hypothetical protein